MYKTLLIHGMPPKNYRFHGVEEIELLFIRHFKTSFVTEHNFFINPSNRIKNFDFEAIILTSTFLSKLSHPKSYNRLINKYAFIKNKNSIKIGLPQDDYWAQSIKDDWYSKNLDIIVSVFDKKHWPLLYPKSIKNKVKIIRGHTTYINKSNFSKWKNLPYSNRKYDVVYRTVGNPVFPNKLGLIKSKIGEIFKRKHETELKLNISKRRKDLIFGEKWLEFLSNSKAVLGSNSGSSIIIRNHDQMLKLIREKSKFNDSLETFEESFFKKNDRNHCLTDISPRNIEAARTMTLQVLIEGDYGGVLKKDEDYFCLKEDLSNSSDLLKLLQNKFKVEKITENCYNRIKESETLCEENLIGVISNQIEHFLKKKPRSSNFIKEKTLFEKINYMIFNLKYLIKFQLKFFFKN